jgi:hypothetical protein
LVLLVVATPTLSRSTTLCLGGELLALGPAAPVELDRTDETDERGKRLAHKNVKGNNRSGLDETTLTACRCGPVNAVT